MLKRKKQGPWITTVKQAKRLITIVIGFTIVLVGLIMIFTPGPGLAAIVIGLALLGTEFVWAKKLMKRFEHHANSVKNSFVNTYLNNNKNT
jgi:tellurite resistance protein TerC/cation:H+ antiporter